MTDIVSGIGLKIIGQPGFRLESLGFLVGMLLVACVTMVVGSRHRKAPTLQQVNLEDRSDDKQAGIALVALYIQIVQVVHLQL